MRLREVLELLRGQRTTTSGIEHRLNRCLSIDDIREEARKRLPRVVFDYIDGGADEEVTLANNRAAFKNYTFAPRTLQDVSQLDLTTSLFGRKLPAPLALSPTGYTRMIQSEGESAVGRAARTCGLPYVLSTVGTTSIEDLAMTQHQELWFQLYVLRDRDLTHALVDRAAAGGYRVLEVAVDTAVSGRRERDVRNGLTIPPMLTTRTILDIARHLRYWTTMVRSPSLEFANLGKTNVGEDRVTAANTANLFDPSVKWDDLARLREQWPGPMLLKGSVSLADAQRAIELGVNGIHLSNHGGRQLDRSTPTLNLVRPLRQGLGNDVTIVLDSGIRHGADIAMALALGADLCAVGRPYLFGLAAGGEYGVVFVINLLLSQLRRTMQLLGVASVGELRENGDDLISSI